MGPRCIRGHECLQQSCREDSDYGQEIALINPHAVRINQNAEWRKAFRWPSQPETEAPRASCYLFCKRTAIYVLDFFPIVGMNPPVSGSFFPLQLLLCSLHGAGGNFGGPTLAVMGILGACIFLQRRKSSEILNCVAELSSICFSPKPAGVWPKSLPPFHKFVEKLREHVGRRKLFKATGAVRKEGSDAWAPGVVMGRSGGQGSSASTCPL